MIKWKISQQNANLSNEVTFFPTKLRTMKNTSYQVVEKFLRNKNSGTPGWFCWLGGFLQLRL